MIKISELRIFRENVLLFNGKHRGNLVIFRKIQVHAPKRKHHYVLIFRKPIFIWLNYFFILEKNPKRFRACLDRGKVVRTGPGH